MTQTSAPNAGENTGWSGRGGANWVKARDVIDGFFAPIDAVIVSALPAIAEPTPQVLDVGCGTGSTGIKAAIHLSPDAKVLGVDLSDDMLAAAAARAKDHGLKGTFIKADAGTHDFDPGRMDLIVSRFGVMFFEDEVAAFQNLRAAAKPGASLRAIAWRGAEENPFMTLAETVATPLLPEGTLPQRTPGGPGQFAFADGDRVADILARSGWRDIRVEPVDIACTMPKDALLTYLTLLGPVGRIFHTLDEATQTQVVNAVLPAFAPYVAGDTVRCTAACWKISAEAP
ncbi:MAG: class I SAM-dependent methyltransferase, partial [Pseudomonadota bacterium]